MFRKVSHTERLCLPVPAEVGLQTHAPTELLLPVLRCRKAPVYFEQRSPTGRAHVVEMLAEESSGEESHRAVALRGPWEAV